MSRLYAASWRGASFNYGGEDVGYIVGVKPKGYTPEALPDFEKASDGELVKLLESPSARRRLEAVRGLGRRGAPAEATVKALVGLAGNGASPLASRVAAVFALNESMAGKSTETMAALAKIGDIQAWVIRALADRPVSAASAPLTVLQAGCESENVRVRLESVVALARTGKVEGAGAILPLLGDADPVIAHTAFRALVELKAADACFTVVDRADASYEQRKGALYALMRMREGGGFGQVEGSAGGVVPAAFPRGRVERGFVGHAAGHARALLSAGDVGGVGQGADGAARCARACEG
jgi:HEAT repeat protein